MGNKSTEQIIESVLFLQLITPHVSDTLGESVKNPEFSEIYGDRNTRWALRASGHP